MIFVTVGTHEQPFDRLVKTMDELKKSGEIQEEIIIQTGYCEYEPQYCMWKKMFSYQEMVKNVEKARIVITHGGPSSFIMPLQIGKIPIVVPRQKRYEEHVNDHQLEFVRAVAERQKNIIVVEEMNKLLETINNYEVIVASISSRLKSNNEKFNMEFEKIVQRLCNQDI